MDVLPQPERRFFGHSSGQNASASAPPSLKATSFKTKNSIILKLPPIIRRRRAQSGDFGSGPIRHKDLNILIPTDLPGHRLQDMGQQRESCEGAENNTSSQETPDTTQRKPDRSKTIMRLFSTKFRPRSPPTPTRSTLLPRSPTQITSAFGSKEAREAALRERGLLPPLKANVDLSLAEYERDRLLPILTPPSNDDTVDGEGMMMSAALRVKHEWEAKHMDARDEFERMKNFTFGRPTSPPALEEPSTSLLPSATVEPSGATHPIPSDQPPPDTMPPVLTLNSRRSLATLGFQLDDPSTAVQRLSSAFEPHLIPLPPSPSPSSRFPRSREELAAISLAASFPLPPSPGLSVPQGSPVISITPPTVFSSELPQHSRAESGSSRVTAVSGAASHGMTASTADTSESSSSPNIAIPLIVESPIEESPIEEESLLKGSITGRHIALSATTSEDGVLEVRFSKQSTARIRNSTDPTPGELKTHRAERRKSFNPFKRNQASPPAEPPVVSLQTPSRRLSMGASLNNMRRSVIGTLSRPKPAGLAVKVERAGFDASHLPPSPTIPAVFAEHASSFSPIASPKWTSPFQQQQQQRPMPPDFKTRIPVSPTLYSRGGIVAETNNIEDDESRRMTELAFLG
ncbi:hypothetical protein C0991_009980 [Blastosporella zonata]|nr:hypothetical protein C0991_009980 [Blastosporella zonata]